jgi:hypothetical protein
VLRGTPIGELPRWSPTDFSGGALIYIYVDQQSGQRLLRAIDNHRLESVARLKATEAKNLQKPLKVTVNSKDKIVRNQDELLK